MIRRKHDALFQGGPRVVGSFQDHSFLSSIQSLPTHLALWRIREPLGIMMRREDDFPLGCRIERGDDVGKLDVALGRFARKCILFPGVVKFFGKDEGRGRGTVPLQRAIRCAQRRP